MDLTHGVVVISAILILKFDIYQIVEEDSLISFNQKEFLDIFDFFFSFFFLSFPKKKLLFFYTIYKEGFILLISFSISFLDSQQIQYGCSANALEEKCEKSTLILSIP